MDAYSNKLMKKLGNYVVLINYCLLISVFLLILAGLFFTLGYVSSDVPYGTGNMVSYEGNNLSVHLNFNSHDGFFAQKKVTVVGNLNVISINETSSSYYDYLYEDKSPKIFIQDPFSKNFTCIYGYNSYLCRDISPKVFIKDASTEDGIGHYLGNMTGVYVPLHFFYPESVTEWYPNPVVYPQELKFPFEGDYEAFIVFDQHNNTGGTVIPIGRVIHVSSPESAILFTTNRIATGLTFIAIGMTIFQIWFSLRQRDSK